ncbi:hypothetical protein Droror1_Dr00019071 [Drosera rotundifolia]
MLVYGSDGFRKSTADRVLRLLMLCKGYEVPVRLVDRLKWDLGLPDDYIETIVPRLGGFDYGEEGDEERVGVSKGMPIVFPMSFSKEFVMDKRDEEGDRGVAKLPYVSPYDNVLSPKPRSEESDKWAVAVLHERFIFLCTRRARGRMCFELGSFWGSVEV